MSDCKHCEYDSLTCFPTEKSANYHNLITESNFCGNSKNGFITIHYREIGAKYKNKGKNIVLIHGIGLTGESFKCLMVDLYHKGYYVLALDRRGWGKSEKPDEVTKINLQLYATDVRELCRYLNVLNPILGGHSFGACIATQYYFQYEKDPNFSAHTLIYLCGAVDPFIDPEFGPLATKALESKHPVKALAPIFVQYALTPICQQAVRSRDLEKVGNFLEKMALQTTPVTLRTDFSLVNTDFRNELANITIPVLFIHGNNDHIVLLKTSYANGVLIPQSNLIEIFGGSHVPMLDHYEFTSNSINEFLKHRRSVCSLCFNN